LRKLFHRFIERIDRVSFVRFILTVTVTVAGVVAALLALHSSSLSSAVLREPDRRWILDQLPAGELASVKMSYANETGRFDIGLFGNSRIVMVGADTLNLPGARMFNFGLHIACNSLKIECYGPPLLTGPGWVERDHAPASLLGAWLEKIIRSGA